MTKLRIGVIGLGMGHNVAGAFDDHPDAEVVAIADLKEALLKNVGDKHNIANRYATGEEMLAKEQLDIVHVSTPNNLHKPLTVAALDAGCHVLCEKPMALNAEEAREMIEAARRADRRLMINFSFRFAEASWAMKREIDSGALGKIYFGRTIWLRRRGIPWWGDWFREKAKAGGGPLVDLGVHRVDLALWLMGHPKPVWVLGSTYDDIATEEAKKEGKPYDVEDYAAAIVRFDNGATLAIEASWAAHIKEWELMETRILGTKGGLVQRNLGEGYDFEAEMFLERNGVHYDLKPHLVRQGVRPQILVPGSSPGIVGPVRHFVDCIRNNKPHIATGEEGLIVMQLLDAIYESAEKGEPVRVR